MSPGGEIVPVRGLPGSLPAGERLIWQGAPQLRATALRVFQVRKVGIYFAALAAFQSVAALHDGATLRAAAQLALTLAACGLAACGILAGIAWLVCRTTVYSITSRRVVMKIGVALPITFNLPFAVLEAASVKLYRDGTGTIPLVLTKGNRLAYAVLWPHIRPWHSGKAQPALRLVPDAAIVARRLAEAVAAASPDRIQVAAAAVQAAEPVPSWPLVPGTVSP